MFRSRSPPHIAPQGSVYSCHVLPVLSKHNGPQFVPLPTLLAHTPEYAFIVLPQLHGCAVLGYLAVAQNQDAIKISNGAQAMGNDNERGVGELFADAALDQTVRMHINSRGRLVEYHDTRAADDGTSEAKQLPLSLRKVQTAF